METYKTYIGIYLNIPYYKHTKEITILKNPITGKEVKDKYDKNTGIKSIIEKKIIIEYLRPNSYIVDEIDYNEDEFWTPAYCEDETQVFLISENNNFNFNIYDDLFTFDISNININELILEFKMKYKKYIDYYIKLYNQVDICFGVVNYAN
jgi:hypothetical protein